MFPGPLIFPKWKIRMKNTFHMCAWPEQSPLSMSTGAVGPILHWPSGQQGTLTTSWALQGHHFWCCPAFSDLIGPLILAHLILLASGRTTLINLRLFLIYLYCPRLRVKSVIRVEPMSNQSRRFIHSLSLSAYLKNIFKGIEGLQQWTKATVIYQRIKMLSN